MNWSLQLTGWKQKKPLKKGDAPIMMLALESNATRANTFKLNRCRTFIQVAWMSETVTADGKIMTKWSVDRRNRKTRGSVLASATKTRKQILDSVEETSEQDGEHECGKQKNSESGELKRQIYAQNNCCSSSGIESSLNCCLQPAASIITMKKTK